MTTCGDELWLATGNSGPSSFVCVNPAGHKGAHAWHRDRDGEHVTVVWWPTKAPKRKRKAKTKTPTQEELL